jgi:spermidine synthase
LSWFTEHLHKHCGQTLEIDEILYEGKTEFQDVMVFRNKTFGKVMILDGVVQTTEGDEFIYHEMFSHVPIVAHGNVRNVLIIGGGDGGLLEEVLKHPVESVTEVELDPGVVDIARTHLRSICGDAYEDPRTDLVIGDGARYVAETDKRFDVIMVDSTDPIGPGAVLFSREFYADCKRCLTPGGVLVTQNGVPFVQPGELTGSVGHFRALFADGSAYVISVPTYAEGFMALGWATDDTGLRKHDVDTIARRWAKAGIETRYYNPETHVAALALPNYLRALLP